MSRPKGFKMSEDHKRKISEAQKGKKGYWYGKKMPEETRLKMSKNSGQGFGEDNSCWRGGGVSVKGIHAWLAREFGSPRRCDNPSCRNKDKLNMVKRFDWALIPGMKYERKRENFKRLCRSCHVIMDGNGEKGYFKKDKNLCIKKQ